MQKSFLIIENIKKYRKCPALSDQRLRAGLLVFVVLQCSSKTLYPGHDHSQDIQFINPVVPDAHYSERKDRPFSLQIQRLEVDLKLNGGFFLHPGYRW